MLVAGGEAQPHRELPDALALGRGERSAGALPVVDRPGERSALAFVLCRRAPGRRSCAAHDRGGAHDGQETNDIGGTHVIILRGAGSGENRVNPHAGRDNYGSGRGVPPMADGRRPGRIVIHCSSTARICHEGRRRPPFRPTARRRGRPRPRARSRAGARAHRDLRALPHRHPCRARGVAGQAGAAVHPRPRGRRSHRTRRLGQRPRAHHRHARGAAVARICVRRLRVLQLRARDALRAAARHGLLHQWRVRGVRRRLRAPRRPRPRRRRSGRRRAADMRRRHDLQGRQDVRRELFEPGRGVRRRRSRPPRRAVRPHHRRRSRRRRHQRGPAGDRP